MYVCMYVCLCVLWLATMQRKSGGGKGSCWIVAPQSRMCAMHSGSAWAMPFVQFEREIKRARVCESVCAKLNHASNNAWRKSRDTRTQRRV